MAKFEKGEAVKEVARERISLLFSAAKERPSFSRRYIALARELGMNQRLRFGKEEQSHFCRKCGAYLVPGRNLTVRVQHGKVIRICGECGNVSRIPLHKQKE